jgi:LacI family transcriptional regulator
MAVTIQEVADLAGVSIGTVSRYLNGAQLRAKNRESIESAVSKLGFKKQLTAIPVFCADLTRFFITVIKAIERCVQNQQYNIIICDYEEDPQKLRERLESFQNTAIGGIVLFPSIWGADCIDLLQEFMNKDIPIVTVNEKVPGLIADSVTVDNARASFWAMEHLIRANHTDVLILNGRDESSVSQDRLKGCLEALETCNVPVKDDWVKWADFSTEGGYQIVKEVFNKPKRPTAIYSTNYEMTLGAVIALNELNLGIPNDVSIIGFDRFIELDLIKPPLTVIEQPMDSIGNIVGELIMKRIKGELDDFPKNVVFDPKMRVKGSVKKLII